MGVKHIDPTKLDDYPGEKPWPLAYLVPYAKAVLKAPTGEYEIRAGDVIEMLLAHVERLEGVRKTLETMIQPEYCQNCSCVDCRIARGEESANEG